MTGIVFRLNSGLGRTITNSENLSKIRRFFFPFFCLLLIALFFHPLRSLLSLALKGDKYSQILIVPFLSVFFLFTERRSLVVCEKLSFLPAILFVGSGCAVLIISRFINLAVYPLVNLDFMILSFLLIFIGGTVFFFGISLIASNRFPWLLLLLLIPLPSRVLGVIITFFQYGSAEVVNLLFQLTGMTYIRDGLTFNLPSISIFIAKECSGIRSSTALFITALLAGHLFLKTIPGNITLLLGVVPLTLLKNGIRITTLSILSEKIDTKWITDSHLHHNGGIVFFGIILVLLFALLLAIRKIENIILKTAVAPTPPLPPFVDGEDSGVGRMQE